MLLFRSVKCERQEALGVSLVHFFGVEDWGCVSLPTNLPLQAYSQPVHSSNWRALQALFFCVLVLPSQCLIGILRRMNAGDWYSRTGIVSGRRVLKVIGNGRTGWYEECEPERWNRFWTAQAVLKAVLFLVQNRAIWCGLWVASPGLWRICRYQPRR